MGILPAESFRISQRLLDHLDVNVGTRSAEILTTRPLYTIINSTPSRHNA